MPEMGFDDEPISPVSREETVTNRNPKAMIISAPKKRRDKVLLQTKLREEHDHRDQRDDAAEHILHRNVLIGPWHARAAAA